MATEMTRITDQRLFLAILAALHFLAAPCAMAMAAMAGDEPCEHCEPASAMAACATTAVDPGSDDEAPAPGRLRLPEPPGVFALVPVTPAAVGRPCAHPSQRIGRETGRHTGDPPLNVLFGKFLN